MKTRILNLMAAAAVALTMVSCGAGGFGTLAMDSEDAVNKVKDLVTSNVDPDEWKIIQIDWNEGTSNDATLGNNLYQGSIFMKLVKSDGKVFSQGFTGQLGFKATPIEPDFWYDQGLDYEKITPIDMSKFDPTTIVKQIEEAKKMIPAEYEFKSLAEYSMKEGIPQSRDGKGEYTAESTSEFTINVVEKGNETVSNAGTTSIIYYEIDFNVAPDGTITMELE